MPLRVLIAPQSFKGSLSARRAAAAIADGVRRSLPDAETNLLPIADGGDGTLDTILGVMGGTAVKSLARDPLGRRIEVEWGFIQDVAGSTGSVALLDLARVSGLTLLKASERNPLLTNTAGFGELFRDALDRGCRKFIAGIGGSATNDGGCGMAEELGIRFLSADGDILTDVNGSMLQEVRHIDASGLDARVTECSIEVMCDVVNPLCGEQGAARVFGPQKGADSEAVEQLDRGLMNLAEVIRKDLGRDVANLPGAGAAGGLGGGLAAFMRAELRRGAELVLDLLEFDKQLAQADLLIVGEGRFDASSAFNKAPVAAAGRAQKLGVPVIGIGGRLGAGHNELFKHGIGALFAISELEPDARKAIDNASALLPLVAAKAALETAEKLAGS